MNLRTRPTRILLALLAALPVTAFAQEAAPPQSEVTPEMAEKASGTQLEKLVVTAQKRTEDVRKVPLSVSVLTGEALKNNQIEDFADLSRSIPNVSFSSQAGAGLSNIEIRGVSSQAGAATVGVYLDDVSLTTRNLYSQGTAEPRFFDIDRVEVLRGPQGTLYGASSLGGTIRYISHQPDMKNFSGDASAETSYTEYGGMNYQAQAVINAPIVEGKVAIRFGVQAGHDSGYIDQVDYKTLKVIDSDINSNDWTVAKFAAKFALADGWTLTPALFWQEYRSHDIDASYLRVGDFQPVNAGTPLDIFQTSKTVREPGTDRLTVPSVNLTGDVDFADLTAIYSHYQRRFNRTQDGTYVNSSYIGTQVTDPALGAIVGNLPSAVLLNNSIDQDSLELRLTSKSYEATKSRFTWVGGFYYSRTRTEVVDNEPVYGITAAFANAGKDVNNPNDLADSFPGAFPNDNSYFSARHYDDKQYSFFGEVTWHVSDTLRGIVGLRYLTADQGFERQGDYYFAGGPTSTSIHSTDQATTPRFAIDWDVTPNDTVYTNIAKGFRLGAANRPIPNTSAVQEDLKTLGLPGFPTVYQPDSLWSYEIGNKARLRDNSILFNVAAFYIDWSDIQQDVVLPVSGYDFETNVGRATSYGLEAEFKARVTHDLTVSASAGLTHATFAEDVPALGTDENGDLNVHKGDWIQGVPKYNATLGGEYRFGLFTGRDAIVRLSGQWVGSSHGSLIRGQSDYDRPAYFTADASFGLSFAHCDLSLFVKNMTNEQAILQQPSIQSVSEAYRLRPRTWGLGVSVPI